MIPRHRQPTPPPESEVPVDTPPTPHTAVDYEFVLTGDVTYSFSIVDGSGAIEEREDRYVCSFTTERTEVMKSALLLVRVTERTWETAPLPFNPQVAH